MPHIDRIARGVLFAGVLCAAGVGRAQDVAPINDRPNPYRTSRPSFRMAPGMMPRAAAARSGTGTSAKRQNWPGAGGWRPWPRGLGAVVEAQALEGGWGLSSLPRTGDGTAPVHQRIVERGCKAEDALDRGAAVGAVARPGERS